MLLLLTQIIQSLYSAYLSLSTNNEYMYIILIEGADMFRLDSYITTVRDGMHLGKLKNIRKLKTKIWVKIINGY